jgi:apolipoprotein N-acyltransferase
MRRAAESVILAAGWRRHLIGFFAGSIGALAMAPADFWPAMFIPMTVAVWLLDGAAEAKNPDRGRWHFVSFASLRSAFTAGWFWGFGYFVAGLWWLGSAFLVEAEEFAWALPLGVLGLPAVLAFFPALGFALARFLWAPGFARPLALAVGLGLSEWLRGHVLTGFPWNAYGMALGDHLVFAQLASVVGLYGLTVVAILIFATPALLADRARIGLAQQLIGAPVLLPVTALAAIAAFGAVRLAADRPGVVENVRLRIMQPNLNQDAKFNPANKDVILDHYLSLSDRATAPEHNGAADATHLIWPESAFPFILSRDRNALARIAGLLAPGTVLVTGAAREDGMVRARRASDVKYLNAIQVVDGSGTILDSYDKVHLVPFGEYLPLGFLLERLHLRQFVHIPGGFEAGRARRLLDVPGLPPVAPLICYEAIFPGEVTPETHGEAADLLLNVTNDGWFGRTSGPYQHFAQARLRAIEEGLPLIRAANTGISAVVDPYGRILSMLPIEVEGVIDSPLPQKIVRPLYARFPFTAPLLVWLTVVTICFAWRRRV